MKAGRFFVRIILALIAISFCLTIHAVNPIQEPNAERQYQDGFKERYSGRKFNYEGNKIVNQTQPGNGDYADYKNENPQIEEKNNNDSATINLGPFSWLFYVALILAVLYLAYILLNEGSSGLFSSRQGQKLKNHDAITAENIENADVNALIRKAENDNDYRLAIRYYYLLVLKTLSLKNFIKFEDDKTNAEYLNEIDTKPFSKNFAYASYLYNYIWYGEFPLNIEQYKKAKHNFVTFLDQVK